MQGHVNTVIDTLNTYIIQKNAGNGMATPHLHKAIRVRRGRKGHNYYAHVWDKLHDGVHPTENTIELWAASIQAAIKINRKTPTHHNDTNTMSSDSDQENKSPKRSWRRERPVKRSKLSK